MLQGDSTLPNSCASSEAEPPAGSATDCRDAESSLALPGIVIIAPLAHPSGHLGWSMVVSLLVHAGLAVVASVGVFVGPLPYAVTPSRNSADLMASMANPAPDSDSELIVINARDAVKESTEFESSAPEESLPEAKLWSPRKPEVATPLTPRLLRRTELETIAVLASRIPRPENDAQTPEQGAPKHLPRAPLDLTTTALTVKASIPSVASLGSVASRGAEDVELPRPVFNPEITYPAGYSESGVGGKVKLRVKVAADGTVKSIAVHETSGYPALDQAALDGVRNWRFQPARHFGTAIEYECVVPIVFKPGSR